jgi:hypothetical protein
MSKIVYILGATLTLMLNCVRAEFTPFDCKKEFGIQRETL